MSKVSLLRTSTVVIVFLLASCATHEGQYEPDCIAFEGDKIVLRDGRFEWHRFTDERKVDSEGNIVEPFPGFPKTGTYTISKKRLKLSSSDGTELDDRFIVVHAGEQYLLTSAQHNTFVDKTAMPTCALKFTGAER